jgi:hypothetical protein
MHRSGTSMLARMVREWGACAGNEADLMPPDPVNPQGYWEHLPLVRFDDELLAALGSSWFCPPASEAAVRALASRPELRARAAALLEAMDAMDARSAAWVWKDPRLSVLLPFWREVWGNVLFVVPVRSPLESARSIAKRDGYPVSASLLLWHRSMASILENTEGAPRILVRYEALVADPEGGARDLAANLDAAWGGDGTSAETLAGMAAAIHPALRRNRVEEDFERSTYGTAVEKALSAYLDRLFRGDAGPFDGSRFPLYPGWREYLETVTVLQDERRHLHALAVDRDRRLAEKDAEIAALRALRPGGHRAQAERQAVK